MGMQMRFNGGTIFAEGDDTIGPFTLSGWYVEESGDCQWVKRYIGGHDVDYRGAQDGRGIWGTWHIGTFSGGFHIWPLGDSARALVAKHEAAGMELPVPPVPKRIEPKITPTVPAIHGFNALVRPGSEQSAGTSA